MLGFLQVLKPIKWQDLLEEGKSGCNAFQTGAKIYFSRKKYFGVRGTLRCDKWIVVRVNEIQTVEFSY